VSHSSTLVRRSPGGVPRGTPMATFSATVIHGYRPPS
jgi:hypothetical protein